MPDNDRSERIKAIAARPAPDLYHSRFSMSPKSDSIRTLTPSPPSSPSRSPNSLVDCNQDITEDSWMSGVSEVTSPIEEVNNLIERELTPAPNFVDVESDSPSSTEPPRERIEVTIQPIHQHSPIKAPSHARSSSSRTKQPSSRSLPGSSRITSTSREGSPRSKEEVSTRTPSPSLSPRVSLSRKLPPRYLSRWRRKSRESDTGRFKSRSSSRRFRKRLRSPLEKTKSWMRSSERQSRSSRRRSRSSRRWSRSSRRRSRSPRKRSRSPRKRSRSPRKRSRSPRKRYRSTMQSDRYPEERNRSSSLSPISFMEQIKQKYTKEENEEQRMHLSNQKVELNNAKIEEGESSSSKWKKVEEADTSLLLTKRSQSAPVPVSEPTSPNLPKVTSQLPNESSQIPNESSQLPKESSQLPKKSSQLPNESSQLISIEGFNWVINRIPDPQTTQPDQTKPVSPVNQSTTTEEVSFQTIKTTYTKLTSTQPRLDNQSTTKCTPVVAPALVCNPFYTV
eukprot:sb/3463987/